MVTDDALHKFRGPVMSQAPKRGLCVPQAHANPRRCVLGVCAAASCMMSSIVVQAVPVYPANNAVIFGQVDFGFGTPNAPYQMDSDWGHLEVKMSELAAATQLSEGYLNVYSDAGWIVQNLRVDSTDPFDSIGAFFDLAVAAGTDVVQVSVYIDFSTQSVVNFADGPRQSYDVVAVGYAAQGVGDQNADSFGAPPRAGAVRPAPAGPTQVIARLANMPNVQASDMQCVPMAIANSLQYLENAFNIPIPHDHVRGNRGAAAGDGSLVGELEFHMNRRVHSRYPAPFPGNSGVFVQQMVDGKFRYLAQNMLQNWIVHKHQGTVGAPLYGLPPGPFTRQGITSKDESVRGRVTWKWMCDQLAAGEDVELLYVNEVAPNVIRGGHAIRLFECGKTNGQPWVGYVHDAVQSNPLFDPADTIRGPGDGVVRAYVNDFDRDGVPNLGTTFQEIAFVLSESPAEQGACCPGNRGSCMVVFEPECDTLGGRFRGADTECEGDPDGDGVIGACADNCPLVPNSDQENSDGDDFGDACDPCPLDILGDSDFDGVCDSQDLCPDADDNLDEDGNDVPDCQQAIQTIPTVSEWGLVALVLTLLAGSKVYFRRRTSQKAF